MIRAALALLLAASPAIAAPVALPDTRAVLDVPAGWTPHPAHPTPGVVAGYRTPRALLAVTRAAVPNPDAWRAATREAYAAAIVAGLPDLRDVRSKLTAAAGDHPPVLDAEGVRGDGSRVIVRILLFRTYALALALEVAPGGPLRAARAIAASFSTR